MSTAEIAALAGLPYEEVAFRVIRPFLCGAFDDSTLRRLIDEAKRHAEVPVCVGFGISRPEHVKALSGVADGIILDAATTEDVAPVGSALEVNQESTITGSEIIGNSVRVNSDNGVAVATSGST